MEVFMTNIGFTATQATVKIEIARVVHSHPSFAQFNVGSLVNFDVFLFNPKKQLSFKASYRTGVITFTTEGIGEHFLRVCGGDSPRIPIIAGRLPIRFRLSNRSARKEVIERLRNDPFHDPRELQKQEDRSRILSESVVHLSEIQFGWECRDDVFSVEYAQCVPSTLHFSLERREFEISLRDGSDCCENIVIPFSHIQRISATRDSQKAYIFISLHRAPRFEYGPPLLALQKLEETDLIQDVLRIGSLRLQPRRRRMSSLTGGFHRHIAPYVSLAMQVACTPSAYKNFVKLWELSEVNLAILSDDYRTEHRSLFSSGALKQVHQWLAQLRWPVAFHVDALLRNGVMDPKELKDIRPDIDHLLDNMEDEYTGGLLRFYREQLGMLWFSESSQSSESIRDCFQRCCKEYKHHPTPAADDLFHCLHVSVTPTSMFLDGPYPEQTNRVIRKYPDFKDHFLRVAFVEEDFLRLRFDSRVDGRSFIDSRVGSILRNGLVIAGRRFEFLHYSQSALKDHAVWFIYPFYDPASRCRVNAKSIIDSLGTFENLPFDKRLIYCPARYAARICQAFTTTDSSITIEPEEIFFGKDIIGESGSCFTDGVGTVSPILAHEMWQLLCAKKRRGFRPDRPRPRAFQIRFQGSKGMISVDHTLKGRVLVLRPSMIKFEAATNAVEIAGVFNKPGKMFLNRPLIMLLEGLDVPGSIFARLQQKAVENVMNAISSLEATATMLDNYGLGQSFRFASVLRNLATLTANCIPSESFYAKCIQNAILHILRDLKHRARIPVPGWTLVGVADVHSYLEEGEVFVCIEEEKGVKKFIEGQVCISRSPTIHPGDVQVARAIGSPPGDSPFSKETLENTVVFSTKGTRSLPSCLGGGDLDGDLYNVTDYHDLLPRTTHEAASYEPARRKELPRPSTRDDVIDFIVDYIDADNVGIIATNWLIIADQSGLGIHDPDCLTLANLHSNAVDYPKSGNAVPMDTVPRPRPRYRPDWSEPETGQRRSLDPTVYYKSERALGRLYRDIDLSEVSLTGMLGNASNDHLNAVIRGLSLSAKTGQNFPSMSDPIWQAVKSKVLEFTDDLRVSGDRTEYLDNLFWTYSTQLQCICSTNALSNKRYSRLTEAEAFIGTIKAKTVQRKRRTDLIAKLREHTTQLVTDVKYELAGGDSMPKLDRLRMAWASWQLSIKSRNRHKFGASSFFWIALSSVFDAIKSIEEGGGIY